MSLALQLDQKEIEGLKPYVDKAVQRFTGLSEPSVVAAALSLLSSGADRNQFTAKIRNLHPSLTERAHKLTDTIFEMVQEYANSVQQQKSGGGGGNKKRPSSDAYSSADGGGRLAKMKRTGGDAVDEDDIDSAPNPTTPSPGQLTTMQIQQMMENAKRVINERKQLLESKGITVPPVGVVVPSVTMAVAPPTVYIPEVETNNNAGAIEDKRQKIAELQAQIQLKLASGGLKTPLDPNLPSKPVPLVLDSEGRAVDVKGNALLFPQRQPTLKANIRAQKKDEKKDGKGLVDEEAEASLIPQTNKYFDESLAPSTALKSNLKGPERKKKGLKFNEPGKYVQIAQKQRVEAKLALLKQGIAEKARKTGIANAARLAKISGTVAQDKASGEYIPQVEWWDQAILEDDKSYDSPIKPESVTELIQHPEQARPPNEPLEAPVIPTFLTKKEIKKMRRQTRRENWKETQEKIRLGLEPPPPAKVRISNLMRVLGTEAVQDPTKVEAHVRKEMAKRLRNHEMANAARKLTPEQRRAKKIRKIQEDVNLGVHVCVYRVDCLANQSKRYKVETNARELHMTGALIMYRECNLVVVEGGPKQQRKYRGVIMRRIKWEEDMVRDKEDTPNKCVLVWEGMVKNRTFSDFKYKQIKSEDLVREFFKKHGVQHYWDAALSGTVLEAVLDND